MASAAALARFVNEEEFVFFRRKVARLRKSGGSILAVSGGRECFVSSLESTIRCAVNRAFTIDRQMQAT